MDTLAFVKRAHGVVVSHHSGPHMQAPGEERTVQVDHEKTSFSFGWRENIPSKDFISQLRDAVRHATGLSNF